MYFNNLYVRNILTITIRTNLAKQYIPPLPILKLAHDILLNLNI